MTTTPYAFIKRGNLFIVPVAPAIVEPPPELQSFTKPPDYSLWVNGKIQEPGLQLDRARMTPRLFQEVRDDLTRYSPVEVTRSAIRRSSHAYVGIIDSKGKPYYFALDSRGVSVREAEVDEAAWKAFDRLAEDELKVAVTQRRADAADEMRQVDHELSEPLVVTKGLKYGKKADWKHDAPGSHWWRNVRLKKLKKPGEDHADEPTEKAVVSGAEPKGRRDRPGSLLGAKTEAKRNYTKDRVAHEGAGGVAVGHSRIRAKTGDEAKPASEVRHYAHRPEHTIAGPGHRVAGEPEPESKPRGTTSIWRHGDDERRQSAQTGHWRGRQQAQQAKVEERKRQSRQIESDERAHRMTTSHHEQPQAAPAKKRSWLHRLLGKGDAPLVVLPRCHVVQMPSDASERAGLLYVSEYRRVGAELAADLGEEDLDPPRPEDIPLVVKALPKKNKESKTKKTPSRKASSKKLGVGGKTRYAYPQEAGGGADQKQTPLIVMHDDTKRADPAELANQLNVSVRTLQRTARRLGSDGFATFMRSRLKRFAMKHRLDPDYWNTLYATLSLGDVAKSEAAEDAWRRFGRDVNAAASAVPEDHPERFGDRKVFIHHVHHEMKQNGTYSGTLDEFKNHVLYAHKKGHLEAARADLVSAMNPRSVEQSETNGNGAQYHFITNVKHDPAAMKKQPANQSEAKAGAKPKTGGDLKEAARAASQAANAATIRAQSVKTRDAHLAAMTAHHQAGAAHQKASGKVGHKTALRHFDQSMVHLGASKEEN